jgi:hypothetical protein
MVQVFLVGVKQRRSKECLLCNQGKLDHGLNLIQSFDGDIRL